MGKGIGQIYSYNGNELSKEDFITEEYVANFSTEELFAKNQFTWINFYLLGEFSIIEDFCKKLNLDSLVFQNIEEEENRPQFEDYGDYLFFTVRSAVPSETGISKLHQEQLSFILGKNYLISIQSKPLDFFNGVRDRLENNKGIIRDRGTDFLLIKLLDAIIDNYFNVVDENTNMILVLDTNITKENDPKILSNIEYQKRQLIELKSIVMPMKEIAVALENSNSQLFKKQTRHYITDLRQNCVSIIEEIEVNKNSLDGLTNLYYAVQGQRMNEIIKLLTIVSTIFIPLTFIAGVYGMNFKNMPELEWYYGYPMVILLMIIVTLCLLYYFRRRGWLDKK